MVVVSLVSVVVMLTVVWFFGRRSTAVDVGRGYQVPTLSGWQKDDSAVGNEAISARTFRQKVDGTSIMVKFVLMPPSSRADTAADLAKSAQDTFRLNAKMGLNEQVLLSKATSYRGHPAYLTKTLKNKNGIAVETQILRVADGKNQFWFWQSLSGQPISAEARTVAGQAWQTLTNDLQGVAKAG